MTSIASKNCDGSSSSRCTAVTKSDCLARVSATLNRRCSSCIRPLAAMTSSWSRGISGLRLRSTNRSAPSNDERCLRLGQVPSCKPAIATKSHCRPFALCTVRISTKSGRTPLAVMTSPAISSCATSLMKAAGPDNGKRSEYRAADSNNCIIASKSRSAAAPRTPGRSA
ncbi:unannotated protein [freshwater metagenome]|uniref:Unannotated protein n=1 Tax=freshwater metagenome TaxID=449393 RepID=A0A6J6BRM3_9ZZZZ